jgi:hypothetical protein
MVKMLLCHSPGKTAFLSSETGNIGMGWKWWKGLYPKCTFVCGDYAQGN